jgi:hypothetical protein
MGDTGCLIVGLITLVALIISVAIVQKLDTRNEDDSEFIPELYIRDTDDEDE